MVVKLLDAGAKFNRLDCKNFSPLCLACRDNKLSKSTALLKWRADVNGATPSASSLTPLMIACSKGYHDIVSLVRRAMPQQNSWGYGCGCGHGLRAGARGI